MSRPTENGAILDAGLKALAFDRAGRCASATNPARHGDVSLLL
jgi:hypothetical protein